MFKLSCLFEFQSQNWVGTDIEIRARYGCRQNLHHWNLLSLPEGLTRKNCSLVLK